MLILILFYTSGAICRKREFLQKNKNSKIVNVQGSGIGKTERGRLKESMIDTMKLKFSLVDRLVKIIACGKVILLDISHFMLGLIATREDLKNVIAVGATLIEHIIGRISMGYIQENLISGLGFVFRVIASMMRRLVLIQSEKDTAL